MSCEHLEDDGCHQEHIGTIINTKFHHLMTHHGPYGVYGLNDHQMTHYGLHGALGLNEHLMTHYGHHCGDDDDDPYWCLQEEDYPKFPLSTRAQYKPEIKPFIKSVTSSTHNYDP